MFHRLQVIVNDLKALGEKISDDDVSQHFLMCLPPRFKTLRLIIIRGGLKDITPNQVLGDVMTQETYRVEREGLTKMRRRMMTRRRRMWHSRLAHHPRARKGKAKKEESSDDEEASDFDMESMALFVKNFGKFMKKKGYKSR